MVLIMLGLSINMIKYEGLCVKLGFSIFEIERLKKKCSIIYLFCFT